MNKILIVIATIITISGCDLKDVNEPYVIPKNQLRIVCVDGVAYIRYDFSIAPKFHIDGTLYVCVDTDTKEVIIK